MLLAASTAAVAHADGDPAMDWLVSQPAYLSPSDGGISSTQGRALDSMIEGAAARGFHLKVAVIASRYDLGSVAMLFGDPQRYAGFLGQEEDGYLKGELLVVMPDGYGLYRSRLYRSRLAAAPDRAAVSRLAPPGAVGGEALFTAAETAVRTLALRHGITLASPAQHASSGRPYRLATAGVALAALAVGWGIHLARARRRREQGTMSG